MIISRAQLLRAALAGATLPALAYGRDNAAGDSRPDLAETGARPSTAPLTGGGPLRFAVIGDNTGIARPGVFDAAMRQISWLRPDFVLGVGDLIEGYTEDRAEIARQWNAVEAAIARLGCPFVFTQGNHDVANAETLDAWRERRGPGYYSFTFKGALFVILNSENTPKPMSPEAADRFYELVRHMQTDPDQAEKDVQARIAASPTGQRGEYNFGEIVDLGDRQLGWLRDTLARHPSPFWTFVVIHKPAWKSQSPSFAKAQALLAGRPHTVFAGHTHYFTHEVIDGHDYINMGVTGGIRQRFGAGTMDHVMIVDLTPTGPIYANTRLTGLMDVAGQTGQVRAY